MMKKILLTAILSSVITFLVTCTIFMKTNSFTIMDSINFKSSEGDFYFTAIPSKGRDSEMMDRQFQNFKTKNGIGDDAKLYRTTMKNYLRISKWCEYKYQEEWNYPFKVNL